jgi:hypothetical protein
MKKATNFDANVGKSLSTKNTSRWFIMCQMG